MSARSVVPMVVFQLWPLVGTDTISDYLTALAERLSCSLWPPYLKAAVLFANTRLDCFALCLGNI